MCVQEGGVPKRAKGDSKMELIRYTVRDSACESVRNASGVSLLHISSGGVPNTIFKAIYK
jgi:hypothetical protein